MLRNFREQRWYLLLWLPLLIAVGVWTLWLWVVANIIGGWGEIKYNEAPAWGLLSFVALAFFGLLAIVLFPRKSARNRPAFGISVCLGIATLALFYFVARSCIVYYQPRVKEDSRNVLEAQQKALLVARGDLILAKIRQVCGDLNLRLLGSTHFQPDDNYIFADDAWPLFFTGTTVRLDAKDRQFTFRLADNQITAYADYSLTELLYGKNSLLYDKPDSPKWSTDQVIHIATTFRDVLVDPGQVKLGKPRAEYVHTAFEIPKSYAGQWMVSWPRVDSTGHPFYGDHVTIQIPEGYGPLGAGIFLNTPYTEENEEPMPEADALAKAQSSVYWLRAAERLALLGVFADESERNRVGDQLASADLAIVIPRYRWSFSEAEEHPSARLAWIFWFKPVHHGEGPGYNDSFSLWVDAYTGEVIGNDAML